MTDPHARARLWPASPFELADAHRCPSCFTVLTGPVCAACGLTLSDPRASRVLALGRDIVAVELARQQLIDEIRLTAAAALAARPASLPAVMDASPLAAAPPPAPTHTAPAGAPQASAPAMAYAPAEVAASIPAPVTPAAQTADAVDETFGDLTRSAEAPAVASAPNAPVGPPVAGVEASRPRRRLTVPVLLLIVGVSLVSVAAVFFLLLAWFWAGIAVKAAILGGVTLATIGLASWLRRRGLTATAEGIGALGVVLLALDAWGVRANDLFGLGSSNAAVFAGLAALVVAVLCRAWARLSRLRGPDLAASLALPAGIGLLVGGALALPTGEAVTAGLLGAAAGGLVHALPAPFSSARGGDEGVVERLVLALSGLAALVTAAITAAFATGDSVPVALWASGALLVLGAAYAWFSGRALSGAGVWARVVSSVGSGVAVYAAATVGWQLALRTDLPLYAVFVAPVLAVAVAFAIDVVHARFGGTRWLVAALTSAVIAALSIGGIAIAWGIDAEQVISSSWTAWATDAFALPPNAAALPLLGVATAVVIAALLLLAPTLRGHEIGAAVPVVAALVVIMAGLRTGVPAVTVGLAVAGAALAVVFIALARRRRRHADADGSQTTARAVGWLIAGALCTLAAYVVGTATPWLWLVGVVAALAYPIALRLVWRPAGAGAVVTALTPVAVAVVSALIAPSALAAATMLDGGEALVVLALVQWIALATLAAALALPLDRASRFALAVASEALVAGGLIGAVTVPLSSPVGDLALALGEPVSGVVRGILLLAGLVAVTIGLSRITGAAVVAAAALVAPVAAATVFDLLRTLGTAGSGGAVVALTAAAVIVPVAGAVLALVAARRSGAAGLRAEPTPAVPTTAGSVLWAVPGAAIRRLAADLGAALTVLVVGWGVTPDLVWAELALAAVGLAAASLTRGWAAPAGDPADGLFAMNDPRSPAALNRWVQPLPRALRRLLVWPAAAAAIGAWWSWLGAGTPAVDYTVESYVVPAALLLVALAAAFVWLRRRLEASIALGAGLAIGLWIPAVAGWSGEPLRGLLVALISVAVCLALSFTAVRGIRPVAPVGAAVAAVAVGLVAIERADDGEWQVLWLVLLVAVAYASGAGTALARPARLSSRLYAQLVPAGALVAAIAGIVPLADEPRIIAGSLLMLAALHLASAGLDRLPLTALTRWISLAGAAVIAAFAVLRGAAPETESVWLPVAAMCLVGAVLGMLRRRQAGSPWPDVEGVAWIGGLVLAAVPGLFESAEPARVWAYVGLALAAGLGVAAVRDPRLGARDPRLAADENDGAPATEWPTGPAASSASPAPDADVPGLPPSSYGVPGNTGIAGVPAPLAGPELGVARTPKPMFPDVWTLRAPTAILLAASALAMGVRGLFAFGFDSALAAAIVAAVGSVAIAVLLAATAASDGAARATAWLAGAGVALIVVTTVTHSDASAGATALTAVIGGAVGVGGAAVLGLRRWVRLGAVLAIGGLVIAVVACGIRFLALAADPADSLEPDLWAIAGAGIGAAIALAALRATPSRAVARTAGAGFALAAVLFAAAELVLVASQDEGDGIRTVLVITALTVATAVGAAARARLGLALSIVAAAAGAVFGVVALTALGVRPVELVTVPAALGGIAYGTRTLLRDPAARSWRTLGPWLALLTVPSLLHDFAGSALREGDVELWRVVGLGVVAIAMVVAGAVLRLQAPLVLGSAVLLVHAVAQLWPWISSAYTAVPWWLWLGLGGALLIFLAARYERRMRALRAAFTAITSLR